MSKFKFHWGHGVMLGLLSFIIFILTLIFLASGKDSDVFDKYYEHSLKYQTETINALRNYEDLSEKPTIKLQANGILISFPKSIKPDSGTVYLMKGAYKTEDVSEKLNLRNSEQLIPAVRLKKGEYDMQLRWSEGNKQYLKKERIEWKML